tara:strand:+ start:2246 stop:2845 length:600 start_codon:yes stop_codon:yes gene_type:complete
MSLAQEVNRIQSTYYYSFDSTCGNESGNGIHAQPGKFSMTIQPFPFPEHNSSQRAIFKLLSVYVVGQDANDGEEIAATDRVSNSLDKDTSGFYVVCNGLGFSKNQYVSSKACSKESGLGFFISNVDGGSANASTSIYQNVSGAEYNGPAILSSNPSGTNITWEVLNAETGDPIPNSEIFKTIVNFCIEIIPDDIVSGRK